MSLDRPALTSLPLELILDTADHLLAADVACLSLTCKSLYYSQPLRSIWTKGLDSVANPCKYPYSVILRHLGHNSRNCDYVQFVRTLRRDMPTHLLCDFCQKLHPKPSPKVLRPRMEWLSCPGVPGKGMCVSWPNFGVRLQFEDVQMVMNWHRWGGQHGAPLYSIATSTDWDLRNVRNGPLPCKFRLEPEIVDENLMLQVTQSLFFTKRRIEHEHKAFDRVLDALDALKVCKHHSLLTYHLFEAIKNIFVDRYLLWSEPGWYRTMTRLRHCSSCYTCFCLEAVYHGDWSANKKPKDYVWDAPADGIELKLHTWMLVGDCDQTASQCWLNLSEQRGTDGQGYPDSEMLLAKIIAAERFERVMLPRVLKQYSQKCASSFSSYPQLLPTIDRAVALADDPSEAKHHELTKILRAARHKVNGSFDMEYLVENALGEIPFWHGYKLFPFDRYKSLRIAMRIVKEHERNNAKAGPMESLWARFQAKLSGVFR